MPSTTLAAKAPRSIAEKATGYFFFPDLVGFGSGQMLATATRIGDSYDADAIVSSVFAMASRSASAGVQIADADIFFASGGEPTIAVNKTIVAMQFNPVAVPNDGNPTDAFTANRRTWSNGGAIYAVEVDAVSVSGFPREITPIVAGDAWSTTFQWFGKIIAITGGAWLSSAYVKYDGDTKYTSVCLRSTDLGYTWTYRGEICAPADVPDSTEGGSETALLELGSGSILAAIRTPGGGKWRARATSADGGATWSAPADWSTNPTGPSSPQLLRLTSGKLMLAIGFGNDIYIAFSNDDGATWPDQWHVNPFHNSTAHPTQPLVTTAYAALVEVEPNRVCIAYDEIPTGRDFQPNDGSLGPNRIWMIDVLVS